MEEHNEQALDALINGVVDLVDGTDPLEYGTATPRVEESVPLEEEAEVEDSPVEEQPAPPAPEPSKHKITWNGQEVELTHDELLAKAQMGFDYTQKTQELSKKASELAPLEGLMRQMNQDPGLATHIATYFRDRANPQAPPVQQRPVQETPPEDPIDRLKWDMRNEIMAQVRQEMQQAAAPILHQQNVQTTLMRLQQDPDFRDVHGEIVKHVESLPQSIKGLVVHKLDNDPRAYMEMFAEKKKEVAARRVTQTNPTPTPVATKVESKAPVLEGVGNQPTVSDVANRKANNAKMKKKALESGDPNALAEWLLASGGIDHIL